jgi:hypothetical protein
MLNYTERGSEGTVSAQGGLGKLSDEKQPVFTSFLSKVWWAWPL